LLGGRLAQRLAALRDVMAAGALFNLYIGSSVRAGDSLSSLRATEKEFLELALN